jgi:hypothetical protein
VAVVGDGCGEGSRAFEAEADYEARQVLARLAVELYAADPGHVLFRIQAYQPVFDRQLHPLLFRLDVVLHDPDGPDSYPPVLGRRANLEGLLGDPVSQLDGAQGVVRVLEGGQLSYHASLFGHDLAGRYG